MADDPMMCERCGERPARVRGLCNRCYGRDWRERNRERKRALDTRSRERNRQHRRTYDRHYDASHRIACEVCGASRHRGAGGPKCARCLAEEAERRRERIAELWRAGRTLRDIAAELDATPGSVGVALARMRAAGYDVPLRHRVAGDGGDAGT